MQNFNTNRPKSQMPWTRCPVRPHILSFTFPDSRRAVVSYWCKYVHEVLVNRLGGLSLPRKSVVRLTDHPNMTSAIYHGCKTTTQQQQLTPIPAPPQMLMLGGGGGGGGVKQWLFLFRHTSKLNTKLV